MARRLPSSRYGYKVNRVLSIIRRRPCGDCANVGLACNWKAEVKLLQKFSQKRCPTRVTKTRVENTHAIRHTWPRIRVNAHEELLTSMHEPQNDLTCLFPPGLSVSECDATLRCMCYKAPRSEVLILDMDKQTAWIPMCNMKVPAFERRVESF